MFVLICSDPYHELLTVLKCSAEDHWHACFRYPIYVTGHMTTKFIIYVFDTSVTMQMDNALWKAPTHNEDTCKANLRSQWLCMVPDPAAAAWYQKHGHKSFVYISSS